MKTKSLSVMAVFALVGFISTTPVLAQDKGAVPQMPQGIWWPLFG